MALALPYSSQLWICHVLLSSAPGQHQEDQEHPAVSLCTWSPSSLWAFPVQASASRQVCQDGWPWLWAQFNGMEPRLGNCKAASRCVCGCFWKWLDYKGCDCISELIRRWDHAWQCWGWWKERCSQVGGGHRGVTLGTGPWLLLWALLLESAGCPEGSSFLHHVLPCGASAIRKSETKGQAHLRLKPLSLWAKISVSSLKLCVFFFQQGGND